MKFKLLLATSFIPALVIAQAMVTDNPVIAPPVLSERPASAQPKPAEAVASKEVDDGEFKSWWFGRDSVEAPKAALSSGPQRPAPTQPKPTEKAEGEPRITPSGDGQAIIIKP